MANTKDYSFREMIYDECFSTGKEFTGQQLMDIVNRKLEGRSMKLIQSRTTFMQDIAEMNEKFYHLYGKYGIVKMPQGLAPDILMAEVRGKMEEG